VKTGGDLTPQVIPEGMGKLKDVYKPLTHIVTEPSHLPGISIKDVTSGLVEATSQASIADFSISSLLGVGAGLKASSFMDPVHYQDPWSKRVQTLRMRQAQIEESKYGLIKIPKISDLTDVTNFTPQVSSPRTKKDPDIKFHTDFKMAPFHISDTTHKQKITTKLAVSFFTVPKQIQKQEDDPYVPYFPSFGKATRTTLESPRPIPIYPEEKKKRRKVDPLGAVGEFRLRPVKPPKLKDVLSL